MTTPSPAEASTSRTHRRWYGHGAFVTLVGFVLIALLPGALFAAFAQPGNEDWVWLAAAVLFGGIALVVYRLLIARVLERRTPGEIAFRGGLAGQGLLLGASLFAFVLGLIAVLGTVTIAAPQPIFPAAFAALALGLAPALIEELFYRGIVFRRLQDWLGTWVAFVASAVLFGIVHATNRGATPWSVTCVIVAGTTFAALYVWSGSLWLPIAAHLVWNSAQAFFGVPVSGNAPPGPLATTLAGPTWLIGDASGIETSVLTPLAWGAVAVLALVLAARRGRIVPGRRRRPEVTEPVEK